MRMAHLFPAAVIRCPNGTPSTFEYHDSISSAKLVLHITYACRRSGARGAFSLCYDGLVKGVSRVLAIDLGERRMGLAISDPLGIAAHGLPTAERRNRREDMNFLKSLVKKHEVSMILVGHPINMDGTAGPVAQAAEVFASKLAKHVDRDVKLWDERLTSVEANRILKESGRDTSGRAGNVDQVAAVLLLESYLESQRRASPAIAADDEVE